MDEAVWTYPGYCTLPCYITCIWSLSTAGNITLSYALDNQIQRFADNPNPINYGLEGGDIVFAVIGTILTAVVLGLVILGFCIHPFFLS